MTCPHLLGLAHNCDDLFLLSKPRGMPPAAPLHLAPLLFFFLSLINILFVFAFWLQCSPSALTNCVEACVGVHMCVCIRDMHFSLCVCVCACKWSSLHLCRFLASTTYQHGRVLDCQMRLAPGDGNTPQGLTQISLAPGTSPLS